MSSVIKVSHLSRTRLLSNSCLMKSVFNTSVLVSSCSSLFTCSKQCLQKSLSIQNGFSNVQKRYNSSNEQTPPPPPPPPPPTNPWMEMMNKNFMPPLMHMNLLIEPNPVAVIYNWIYYRYRLKKIDPNFDIQQFLAGTKKAIAVVSEMISMEDMEGAGNFLTKEALAELSENLKHFTNEQKQRIKLSEDEISLQYIGLFKDYYIDNKHYVEVSVVAHVLQDFKPEGAKVIFQTKAPKVIANYRFRREYGQDSVNCESDWKIVRFNHFYPFLPTLVMQKKQES